MDAYYWARASAVAASVAVAVVLGAGCGNDRPPLAPSMSVFGCPPDPEGPIRAESSYPCLLDDADPNAPGVFTTWSEDMCLWPSWWFDEDQDGVDDSCERATAAAFAPMLVFASRDCNWDHGLDRMGGEYYYAVEARLDDQQVPWRWVLRVAYLMAYYHDCGTASSVEWMEWFDNPHTGDSEFIILDVSYDTTSHHWRTERVFLSAHCGSPFIPEEFSKCKWWSPQEIQYWVDQRVLGAPYVWVARSKHANYTAENVCDNALNWVFLGGFNWSSQQSG